MAAPDPEYSLGPGAEGGAGHGAAAARVLAVIEREFAVSLAQKEEELAIIDERILQVATKKKEKKEDSGIALCPRCGRCWPWCGGAL
jgi:hypothetical protein